MAMEDFRVDVVIGKGPGATAIPLEIPPFTLVGATTRAGLLPGPLRDRFGFTAHLEFYEPDELDLIVHRSAGLLGVELDRRRRRRDRLPLARHPAHRQPAAAPGPRLRPGPRRRRRHARRRPAAPSSSTRSTSPGSTGSTAASSTCCAAGSAAARSASPRSRSRSARSGRPSRRSPSRSWCAAASWPVRRAAGSPRRRPGQHLGLAAPGAGRERRTPPSSRTDVGTSGRGASAVTLHRRSARSARPRHSHIHAREVLSCRSSSPCCPSSASRCCSGC